MNIFCCCLLKLTRKNLMAKNLKRLKKQLEREYGKHEAAKYPHFINIPCLETTSVLFVSICDFKKFTGNNQD